jgi:hypothetical protein
VEVQADHGAGLLLRAVALNHFGPVGADWGVTDPILSKRDQGNPRRDDIPDDIRPRLSA